MIRQLLAWWRRPRYEVDRLPQSGKVDGTAVLMAMVKDLLNDRRAERRSRVLRTVTYFFIFAAPVMVYAFVYAYAAGLHFGPRANVVGVVHIDGEISAGSVASADRVTAALKSAFESEHVKAVVISIDSPGGARVEAERVYRAMDAFRKTNPKPVVAVINNVGASAAYMVALHTDKIYAGRYSLVGSIGALLSGWDFHKALGRVDVAARVYASGSLKAMLNPYMPMTPEADRKANELVQQMGRQFREELDQLRKGKLKPEVNYSSGEIWGGVEAKAVGVIDEIGTLDEVVKGYSRGEAHDFGPSTRSVPFIGAAADWLRGVMVDVVSKQGPTLQ